MFAHERQVFMARQITRYTNHHGFVLQSDTGEYVKYDEVAPYIKEGVQKQTTNSTKPVICQHAKTVCRNDDEECVGTKDSCCEWK